MDDYYSEAPPHVLLDFVKEVFLRRENYERSEIKESEDNDWYTFEDKG